MADWITAIATALTFVMGTTVLFHRWWRKRKNSKLSPAEESFLLELLEAKGRVVVFEVLGGGAVIQKPINGPERKVSADELLELRKHIERLSALGLIGRRVQTSHEFQDIVELTGEGHSRALKLG